MTKSKPATKSKAKSVKRVAKIIAATVKRKTVAAINRKRSKNVERVPSGDDTFEIKDPDPNATKVFEYTVGGRQASSATPCKVKSHFDCSGTGVDEIDGLKCADCDGTGRFCVEHDSACGDMSSPPQCDVAKGRK